MEKLEEILKESTIKKLDSQSLLHVGLIMLGVLFLFHYVYLAIFK
jgi:hypothetical protein